MRLFSEQIFVLLGSEGIDLAAPEREFAACHLLIDLKWDIIYHAARLTADPVAVQCKISRTESLDCK